MNDGLWLKKGKAFPKSQTLEKLPQIY
jgi:hypothetical protein